MPQGFTTDPPIVTALISCDNFNTSIIDKKPSLIGLFDDVSFSQFPVVMPITIVAVLVGVLEQVDVQMYMVLVNDDLTETSTTFGAVSVVQPPPAGIGNTVVVHAPHVFAGPGRFDLRVFGNGTFLAYKPIIIRQLQLPVPGIQPGGQP